MHAEGAVINRNHSNLYGWYSTEYLFSVPHKKVKFFFGFPKILLTFVSTKQENKLNQ